MVTLGAGANGRGREAGSRSLSAEVGRQTVGALGAEQAHSYLLQAPGPVDRRSAEALSYLEEVVVEG